MTELVSKSTFLNDKMPDKAKVALGCILGMFAGFLFSRALLSIAMFLFGINAIRDVQVRQWFRQRWWLLGLCWLAIYALSWFWTENKGGWGEHLQTKLPFLLLPLAFSYQPRFNQRQLQFFTLSVAAMLIISAGYTMAIFLSNPSFYIDEYKVSHMLPTLPKRDHIRSSMSAALFVMWAVYAWPRLGDRKVKALVGVCIALLVVYIHVLAAKTGLLSLYLFIGCWAVYMAFGRQRLLGFALLACIPIAMFIAFKALPTLRERIVYIGYTMFMYQHNYRTDNLSDGARLISYELSADLIKQHPLTGVGAGDMKNEMDSMYAQRYPQTDEHGRLLPHNQFLVVGLGCGIPGMAIFLAWVLWPLSRIRKNRQSFFFFVAWLILFIQLMIEPVLEVQFGVFVYLFFLLLFLQELGSSNHEKESPAN
ncbi:MAG: O-antigen ligase family protein [Taibaiella sp.]|nr:O-antigen ligase family protein [Taibaiella sp.]